MEKWITINGRKLLIRTLITELDWSFKMIVPHSTNQRDIYTEGCAMLYGVQLAADAYGQDKTQIGSNLAERIAKLRLSARAESRLPEAIEKLYNEMCQKSGISDIQSSDWLDKCQSRSEEKMKEILQKEEAEKERKEFVKNMKLEENANADQVSYFMKLLSAKKEAAEYELKEIEETAVRLWCDLLIEELTSDYMSCGTMNYAVQSGLISEGKMSDLIAESQIEYEPGKYKDYDWYSQDFLGCWPGTGTKIKIRDFFRMFGADLTEIMEGKNCWE